MTKQYKGRTATIEIDEKNVIIKSSGFFSSSKKTIPLRDIKNVELSASSFFSKDTVEIYHGSNVEKVQFSNSADAKKAATDITDIARKNRRTSPLGELTGLATSLFGIGVSVASAIKEDQERQRKREIQKAEAEYKKAVDDFLNSGKLTATTYVNGREFNRPTAKDDVEAVFVAEYAKSPRTVEQPWSQKWTEQYGIQDVPAYLQSVVADGYLEEAVLGKALSTLTGEQLKTMLSDLSMKTSGAKGVLIQRLVEEADEHRVRQLLPNPVYSRVSGTSCVLLSYAWVPFSVKDIGTAKKRRPPYTEQPPFSLCHTLLFSTARSGVSSYHCFRAFPGPPPA